MEVQSETPRSRLEGLPPELVRVVLHELSDLTSLRCAILSSRVLWNSFMADPQGIATRALSNELNMCCMLPEAMTALRASELIKPTRSSVQKFCETHVQSRNAEYRIRLTLDQVTRLSRLHATVSRMAKSFAAAALQDLASTIEEYDDLETLSEVPEPSALEQHRIMRTLYIPEAFFGLFDKTAISRTEMRSAMHDFLLNFAHWEVEQMACMQEFLFVQVSRGTVSQKTSNPVSERNKADEEPSQVIMKWQHMMSTGGVSKSRPLCGTGTAACRTYTSRAW